MINITDLFLSELRGQVTISISDNGGPYRVIQKKNTVVNSGRAVAMHALFEDIDGTFDYRLNGVRFGRSFAQNGSLTLTNLVDPINYTQTIPSPAETPNGNTVTFNGNLQTCPLLNGTVDQALYPSIKVTIFVPAGTALVGNSINEVGLFSVRGLNSTMFSRVVLDSTISLSPTSTVQLTWDIGFIQPFTITQTGRQILAPTLDPNIIVGASPDTFFQCRHIMLRALNYESGWNLGVVAFGQDIGVDINTQNPGLSAVAKGYPACTGVGCVWGNTPLDPTRTTMFSRNDYTYYIPVREETSFTDGSAWPINPSSLSFNDVIPSVHFRAPIVEQSSVADDLEINEAGIYTKNGYLFARYLFNAGSASGPIQPIEKDPYCSYSTGFTFSWT